MWRKGKLANEAGTQGMTRWGVPVWVFFYLIYPRLGTEEACNSEMPMSTAKNAPNKSVLSLAMARKGQRNGQKTLRQ